VDYDTFRFGFVDFFHMRGHLVTIFETDHVDLFRTEPNSRARHVHCNIAAAYNENLSAKLDFFSLGRGFQKVDTLENSGGIFRLDSELCPAVRPAAMKTAS